MTRSDLILYVDDDESARTAFVRAMGRVGLEAHAAQDAWRAMKLAKRHTYAVVATDYEMPGLDGFEVTEELRVMQPDATFILVSGRVDLDLALDAVNEHGMTYVIRKPWNIDQLGSHVRRGMEAAWERTAHRQVAAAAVDLTRKLQQEECRLRAALEGHDEGIAEALQNSLSARDRRIGAVGQQVAVLAGRLAQEIGLSGEERAEIERGALLHDLGMIEVPDTIIDKPGSLDAAEWAIMKAHPVEGARLLDGLKGLEGVREIVLQHHERWDGGGYPAGLAGEDICLGARIVAVASTLNAVLSERPYRRAVGFGIAREVVVAGAGTSFDPAIVSAFQNVPDGIWLEARAAVAPSQEPHPQRRQRQPPLPPADA